MQYPEEKWALSPRWRGTHRMLTTETGKAKCVACGLCPTICPANCIKLVPGEDEEGNRYPLVFEIDEFRCIFCGYCQEVCPEEAIHVGRHYENSEYSREGFVYDLERLMAQTHPVCEMWDPADPKGEYEPTLPLFYTFHFYLFGLIAIASALAFVTRKSPVAAALWLVNTMFCLAALYVMLDAQFIGAMQVLVYAGAIMVVFLFVVMLLNLGQASEVTDMRGPRWKLDGGLVGLAMLARADRAQPHALPERSCGAMHATSANVGAIAPSPRRSFNEYLLRLRGDERAAARRHRRRGGAGQAEGQRS